METVDTLGLLEQGADVWNEWRAANPAAAPSFRGRKLRGLDLTNADLSDLDLTDTDLRGTVLNRAALAGARLNGANFFKATLQDADLRGADLRGAQFLNCAQLVTASNWETAQRDETLECGRPLPKT